MVHLWKHNILHIYTKTCVCHNFLACLIVQLSEFTCNLSPKIRWHSTIWWKRTLMCSCCIYQTKQKCWVSEYFPLHLSGYIEKYKHWFYLANKIRATPSTYVISIIISVSCQWVCLYRKFLLRNITSLTSFNNGCLMKRLLVYKVTHKKETYNATKHIVLSHYYFPLRLSYVKLNDKQSNKIGWKTVWKFQFIQNACVHYIVCFTKLSTISKTVVGEENTFLQCALSNVNRNDRICCNGVTRSPIIKYGFI